MQVIYHEAWDKVTDHKNRGSYSLTIVAAILWQSWQLFSDNRGSYSLAAILWQSRQLFSDNRGSYSLTIEAAILWQSKHRFSDNVKASSYKKIYDQIPMSRASIIIYNWVHCVPLWVVWDYESCELYRVIKSVLQSWQQLCCPAHIGRTLHLKIAWPALVPGSRKQPSTLRRNSLLL